jgi:hypothetical protein
MRQAIRRLQRSVLRLEELEPRLVLDNSVSVPVGNYFGQQIVTIQGYQDQHSIRSDFGIFDTGSGAITFSEQDQALFTSDGQPIPIQVPGGASAQGIGGTVVGDLSQPGIIWADGLHAANMSINPFGAPQFSPSFNSSSAQIGNLQAFVGTAWGSPLVPTITGTPILLPSPAHPNGLAAMVGMQSFALNFTSIVPGLTQPMPDLSFVAPGTTFGPGPLSVGPFQIPLSLSGGGDPIVSGTVTEAPVPMINSVTVIGAQGSDGGQRFLLDTGAQESVISPSVAQALGLDLAHPLTTTTIQGVGGSEEVPGFMLKELDVPEVGGTMRFMGVPVFVADLGHGLGGVVGMNVLETAYGMIYDPYGSAGPMLNLIYTKGLNPTNPNPTTGGFSPGGFQTAGSSGGSSSGTGFPITLPFQSAINGTNLPLLQVNSGRIGGQVFVDYNHNGTQQPGEPGLAGVTVYLDLKNDGRLDPGDPTTTTDGNGAYQFTALAPGNYTVREFVPANLTQFQGLSGSGLANVADGTITGVNFSNDLLEPDPQIAFVSALYGDVLDRAPDIGGLNYFTQLLNQGASHDQVAQVIWNSPEHRGLEVDEYYEVFLHRMPDAGGRAYWVNALVSGVSEQTVQIAILTSGEYQAIHPGDASYLAGLYNDLLGRAIDPVGAAVFGQELQAGASRAQVAQQILTSNEYYLRTVDGYYVTLLHRAADPGGQQAWLFLLQTNQKSLDGVAEALLGSSEYAQWSRQFSES